MDSICAALYHHYYVVEQASEPLGWDVSRTVVREERYQIRLSTSSYVEPNSL